MFISNYEVIYWYLNKTKLSSKFQFNFVVKMVYEIMVPFSSKLDLSSL